MLLRTPAPDSIPETASQSMQTGAQAAAARLNSDIAAATQNLTAAAQPVTDDLATGSERALNRIGKANPGFDGMAIVDPGAGTVLATRGDEVPAAPPGGAATTIVGGKLVTTLTLSPTRSLVATSTPNLTVQPDQGRRMLVVDATGHVAAESGNKPTVADTLLDSAVGRASGGAPGVLVDENALHTSGFALDFLELGNDAKPPVTMIGFAPLTAAGFSVLTVGDAAPIPGAAAHPGLVAGIALAAAGIVAFLILYGLLVRPARRLRDDVDDLIDPPAHATWGSTPIRRSRLREADRVATALLAHLRRDPGPTRPSVPLAAVVAVVALVLAVPVAAGFFLVAHDSTRPDLLVQRHQATIETTTQNLDSTLAGGLDALQAVATPEIGSTRGQWQNEVDAVADTHPEFRSVYAQDRSGTTVATSGESPSAEGVIQTAPLGIEQVNTSGAAPIVLASATTPSGRYTIRGEYDPRRLNDVLRQGDAPTRVVDDRMRTVLSSSGYLAFSELDKSELRDAVASATPAPDAGIRSVADTDAVVSTQRLGSADLTQSLHWVVLQDQALNSAKYSSDSTTKAATVVLLVTAALLLATMIWLAITAVLPMRRVAANADRIRSGRAAHEEAPIVSAQRLDEIGAVAAGLNHYAVHFSDGADSRTRG